MERAKKTPQDVGAREYDRERSWAGRQNERTLVELLYRHHTTVKQRENLNRYRLAPFAEAEERAKLQAVRDELATRRTATDTTITTLPQAVEAWLSGD